MTQPSPYGPSSLKTTRRRLFGATALVASPLTVSGVSHWKAQAADPAQTGTVVVTENQAQATVVLPPGIGKNLPDLTVDIAAHTGTIEAPMVVVEDEDAVSGHYVATPTGTSPIAGSVTIGIEIAEAGTYAFSARVAGPSGTEDSFFAQLDDGPELLWHLSGSNHSSWYWRGISNAVPGEGNVPLIAALTVGRHELVIRAREAGARLDTIRLHRDGVATQTGHAADQLIDHVESATGVRLPLATADQDLSELPPNRIHIGWTGPEGDAEAEAQLAGIDVDGFVIASRAGVISIVGGSEWGTRYGVYEFLESELDIAWLMPGADGTDIPPRSQLLVADQQVREEPSFLSRTLPYLYDTNEPYAKDWASDDPQVQWATRQRTHSRITRNGNHNLFNIFPPAVFADPSKPTYRPEIFPIVNGAVRVPTGQARWQPRFDSELTVDIAVTYVEDFFDANPDEPLLSLGVNDQGGYSDTDLDPDLINSIGRPSASRSYYTWVNQVVSRVLTRRPDLSDKIFPILAYENVIDPPDFDLHPSVIPLLCKESHAWAEEHPGSRGHFTDMFDGWGERATVLALYDYNSGHRYLVPRLFSSQIQQAYQYAYAKGMRYSYSDMVPAPLGEGPKAWVYSKMLWDLDADVAALSRQWCDKVAGPIGGEHLFEFYQLWEQLWAGPALDSPFWHFNRDRIYFHFQIFDYVGLVTPELATQARQLLDAATAAADTPARQERMALLQDSYSYYDLGFRSYPRIVPAPDGAREAITLANTVRTETTARAEAAIRRIETKERHDGDPVLRQRIDHIRYNQLWTGYSGSDFWNLHDYVVQQEPDGGPVTINLETQIRHGEVGSPQRRMASMILAATRGERPQLAPNGDLADSSLAPWRLSGDATWDATAGVAGSAGLVVEPMAAERALILPIAAPQGLFAFRMRYRSTVSAPGLEEGTASVKIHLWTVSGANIWYYAQPMRLISDTGTEWASVGLVEDIPAIAKGQEVGQLRLVASVMGLKSNGPVVIDGVSAFAEH